MTGSDNGSSTPPQRVRPSSASALRFTHLSLENWRNFKQVDIDLERRAFLVGPNASGKSNFLDAFRFLRDLTRRGGGLREAVAVRGGVSSIRCLAARTNPQIGLTVKIGHDANPNLWTYQLRLNANQRTAVFVTEEHVWTGSREILNRPDVHDEGDAERLTQTALEQVTANKDFRAVSEFFDSVRYLHLVPQVVRQPDRWRGAPEDPYGGDFLDRVANTPKRARDARLARIVRALQIAVPQLDALEPVQDSSGAWHLRGKYIHWRKPGKWQSEADFSDGTLRLLGLLWALLDSAGPLLLEEPELSLHPEVVRLLPQMFARMQRSSGRQVLVSTHSSDLLQDEGIALDEMLLLEPSNEGTRVRAASEFADIQRLLEAGMSMADIVLPRTRPENIGQLSFFGS